MFCTISSAPMKFLISGVIVSSLFLLNTTEASDFDSSRGNQTFQSFNKAKKALEHNVIYDRRVTIYCGASFDKEKFIDLPNSFLSMKHKNALRKWNGSMSCRLKTLGGSLLNGERALLSASTTEVCLSKAGNVLRRQIPLSDICKVICTIFILRSVQSMRSEAIKISESFLPLHKIHSALAQ